MLSVHTNPTANHAARMLAAAVTEGRRASQELATGLRQADPAASAVASRLRMDSAASLTLAETLSRSRMTAELGLAALKEISASLNVLRGAMLQSQPVSPDPAAARRLAANILDGIATMVRGAGLDGVNLIAGARGSGVTQTQAAALAGTDGRLLTVGGTGIEAMNATPAGLGMADLTLLEAGVTLDMRSLSADSFAGSGGAPATLVLWAANHGASDPVDPAYPRREWRFEFQPGGAGGAPAPTHEPTLDASGNVTDAVTTVAVPLRAGYTKDDALRALSAALEANGFAAAVTEGGIVNLAGNNVQAKNADYIAQTVEFRNFRVGTASYRFDTRTPAALPDGLPGLPARIAAAAASTAPTGSTVLQLTSVSQAMQDGVFDPGVAAGAIAPGTRVQAVDLGAGTVTLSQPTLAPIAAGADLTVRRTVVPAGSGVLPLLVSSADAPGGLLRGAAFDPATIGPYLAPGTRVTGVNPATGAVLIEPPSLTPIPAGTSFTIRQPALEARPWEGAEAGLAVVEAATRKTSAMAAKLGDAINSIEARQAGLRLRADALLAGAAHLVDTDIPKAQARLLAADIREKLAGQALGIANRTPQLLLQLFQGG